MKTKLARRTLAHIAVAVKSLDAARAPYEALGFRFQAPERIAREQVRSQLAVKGNLCIELLEAHPAGKGPIAKFLAQRGPGLHHVALHTADLSGELHELAAAGVAALSGYPSAGAGGSKVAFLDPRTTGGVLFELVEDARPARPARPTRPTQPGAEGPP